MIRSSFQAAHFFFRLIVTKSEMEVRYVTKSWHNTSHNPSLPHSLPAYMVGHPIPHGTRTVTAPYPCTTRHRLFMRGSIGSQRSQTLGREVSSDLCRLSHCLSIGCLKGRRINGIWFVLVFVVEVMLVGNGYDIGDGGCVENILCGGGKTRKPLLRLLWREKLC